MSDRYVLRLGSFPADPHVPLGAEGDLALHVTFETDLSKTEVMKRVSDLTMAMDTVHAESEPS